MLRARWSCIVRTARSANSGENEFIALRMMPPTSKEMGGLRPNQARFKPAHGRA